MSTETLKQAYQLITQGQKAEAIQLLTPLLKTDRDNKNAWWLLAHAATKPEQIEFALKNVLRLDPHHAKAQEKLDTLQAETAADFFSTVTPDEPPPVDEAIMSYFGSSNYDDGSNASNWGDTSDWGDVSDSILAAAAAPQIRTTTPMPIYPRPEQKKKTESVSSANFWFAAAAIILVGACAMMFILYSAGIFDDFLGVLPEAPPPQAGWSTYNGTDLTIQLPDYWQDIGVSGRSDEIIDFVSANAPEFAEAIEEARGDPDLYRFLAINLVDSSDVFTTNIVITSESVGLFMSLDSYLDLSIQQLPNQFEIISQSIREIEPFGEVGVVEANPTIDGISFRQTYYVVKRRSRAWVILYSSDARIYDQLRDDFEYSLSTFRPE